MTSSRSASPGASGASPHTEVRAPFGGLFTLLVTEGQHVASGDVLGILEAMKMEAPITAPRAGSVHSALSGASVAEDVPESSQVAGGDLLVSLS